MDPIAIAGAFKIFVNACIGPVPALEILRRYFPNDLRAASVTSETNACALSWTTLRDLTSIL